ncbi:MAG TPA: carboxypeptidase regulatory-like domain-containing protein [Pyrinomonadaceae bacterium]|nr:carboxypeptidase regulatory-like domain-containing protein [Pyrinomonadaceae bacterium]
MKFFPFRRTFASIALLLGLAVSAHAQEFRATLTGQVQDPSGAAVPNATVTVRNLSTNQTTTANTGEEGNYTIPFLIPGDYSVTVEAQGFKRVVNDKMTLHVSEKITFDVTLEVGQVADAVTVTAEDPLLEASTASRGLVVENMRVNELPLNLGRNPIMLAVLSPGVTFNGNPQNTRPFDNGDNVQFSINGGLNRHNEFLLDGAPNNAITDPEQNNLRSSNNIAFVPQVDATNEFKVMTNTYDAQYGRTSGGVFNVTTKAGGNDFHGTIYEFLRRYQLDANTFPNNAAGRPRFFTEAGTGRNLGGNKLDDYGFVLTGPVMLPRFGEGGRAVYSGRNRTFFMFAYQGYKQTRPNTDSVASVPTALERAGDFSQSGITIYDPLTTTCAGGVCTRQPFPGNRIPAIRLNPVGQAIVNTMPLPNFGAPGTRFNNFLLGNNIISDDYSSYVARIDHNFNDNWRMFGRYYFNRREEFNIQNALGVGNIGMDAQDPLLRENRGIVLDAVGTLSSTTILNVRTSYSRFIQAAFRQNAQPFDATSLGFPASFSASRPTDIVPRLQIEQYWGGETFFGWGPRNPSNNVTNVITLQANLTHIRGRHTFNIGGEGRDLRPNQRGASFSWGGGFFQFDRSFTRQNPSAVDNTGSAIASLLLGYPSGGRIQNLAQQSFRWGYYAGYIQDDIKVTQRLTINLGLRYDYEGPPVERFNRQNRGFAFDETSPLASQIAGRAGLSECPSCSNLRGGLLFAGVAGQPNEAFERDKDNIQPRVGFAYQLRDNTVVRGGYGHYYFPQAEFGGSTGFTIDTFIVPNSTGSGQAAGFTPFIDPVTGQARFSNPFPSGVSEPLGASRGLLTQAGGAITFGNPDHEIPRVQQWSIGVQHQFPWQVRLDLSYVGSRSNDILTGDWNVQRSGGIGTRNINVLSAAQLEQCRQNPTFCNTQVANPFAGLLPGTGLNNATVQRRQLLLPFPQFTDVNMAFENVGRIWYDGLQFGIDKRFDSGLTLVSSYTWSKTLEAINFLNNQDAEPTRVISGSDRTHVWAFSGVYLLPVGRGRAYGDGMHKALDLIAGGWELTWIARLQSGNPIPLNGDADLIGDPSIGDPSLTGLWFNNCVQRANGNFVGGTNTPCDNPAWRLRSLRGFGGNSTADTLRTTPLRVSSLRDHSPPQLDMGLNKSFHFGEVTRLQFRAEAFNVTNTAWFNAPEANPNNPNFGRVNLGGQRNFPRQVQLGFKFIF